MLRFFVNAGDSFYYDCVSGDGGGRWKSVWPNVYIDDDYSRVFTRLSGSACMGITTWDHESLARVMRHG